MFIFLIAAPSLEVSRYRAHASRGLAFAASHFLNGCALTGLHSLPLIFLMAAP
jgi:hypothetical protein